MAGSTTFRRIAGYVDKFTFAPAFRADLRWGSGRDSETALTALPVGQTAVWAYISRKSTRSRITTMSAGPFFLFLFHFERPPFASGYFAISLTGAWWRSSDATRLSLFLAFKRFLLCATAPPSHPFDIG